MYLFTMQKIVNKPTWDRQGLFVSEPKWAVSDSTFFFWLSQNDFITLTDLWLLGLKSLILWVYNTMLTKPDSSHTRFPLDFFPTFQGFILKPSSTTPGKQGKNREISWLENGYDYIAAFCVTEMLSFTSQLCGFAFSFCIAYCVDFD